MKGLWLKEEPLLFNSALDLGIFNSVSLRKALWSAKMTKIGHFVSEVTCIKAGHEISSGGGETVDSNN